MTLHSEVSLLPFLRMVWTNKVLRLYTQPKIYDGHKGIEIWKPSSSLVKEVCCRAWFVNDSIRMMGPQMLKMLPNWQAKSPLTSDSTFLRHNPLKCTACLTISLQCTIFQSDSLRFLFYKSSSLRMYTVYNVLVWAAEFSVCSRSIILQCMSISLSSHVKVFIRSLLIILGAIVSHLTDNRCDNHHERRHPRALVPVQSGMR